MMPLHRAGPYSGTPFCPAVGALDAGGRPLADHEPDEREQHRRGIMYPRRDLSSIGRREPPAMQSACWGA